MRFPEPRNIKQLQSFLGLCNFYRKFQRNYAHTTPKLSAVLQKSRQWKWGGPSPLDVQRARSLQITWKKLKMEMGYIRRHDLSSAQDKEIKKFFLLYEGPYEVVEIKMQNSYVLQNSVTGEIVGTHNATNLKLYWSS